MMPITDFDGVDKRCGKTGRRETDGLCALHNEIRQSDLTCFNVIKNDIRVLEDKMDKLVSKWFVGIATTVGMGFFIVIVGLSGSRIKDVHRDIQGIVTSISKVSDRSRNIMINQARLAAVQENILEDMVDLKKALQKHDKENKGGEPGAYR